MQIKSRADWGAKAPKATTPFNGSGAALHWEGTKLGNYRQEDVPAMLRSIQSNHMNVQKWNDIAYNFAIDRFGTIWECRGRKNQSGANGTTKANQTHRAIVFLIGPGDPFTDPMQRSANELLSDLKPSDTQPHSRFIATQCPGDDVRKWLGQSRPTPIDSAPTVKITTRRYDNVNLQCIKFENVQLGERGTGWKPVPVTVDKIVSIEQYGSFEPTDGDWPVCDYAKQARTLPGDPNTKTVIQIQEGAPKQIISFEVWYME